MYGAVAGIMGKGLALLETAPARFRILISSACNSERETKYTPRDPPSCRIGSSSLRNLIPGLR